MGWQAALKPYVIKLNPSKTVTQKVKGEVFVYDWNNQWNFHSFKTWILPNNLFVVKLQSKFWVLLQIRFLQVCTSPLNLDILP